LNCPHCGELNDDVYYAPTCDFITHRCEHCNQVFGIQMGFYAVKTTDEGWQEERDWQEEKEDELRHGG